MKKQVTKYFTMAAFAGAIMFTSCGVNDEINPHSNEPIAVRFKADINRQVAIAENRTTGTAWTDRERVGIRMINSSGIVGTYVNKEYKASATGVLAAIDKDMFYPIDGSKVDFIAYYPYQSALSGLTYSVNVANQSKPADIDLLWAKTTTGYSKESGAGVALQFSHKLSKMVMKIVKPSTLNPNNTGLGDADLAGMLVTIKGMNTTASFNIMDGTDRAFTNAANPAAIAPRVVADGAHFEAIILPAIIAANTVTVDFIIHPGTAQRKTFTWNVPASTEFKSSFEHEWIITLSHKVVTGLQGSINVWDKGNGGSDVAH